MNLVLLISMVLLTVLAYFISNRDVFSPAVVICSVFALSSLFVLLNEKNWKYEISSNAYLYITVAVLLTLAGIYVGGELQFGSGRQMTKKEIVDDGELSIGGIGLVLMSAICLLVLFLYFRHQYALSVSLGNTSGIMGMISTLRNHVYDEDSLQLGTVLNLGISFLRACGNISIFLVVNELVMKKRIGWKYMIPVGSIIIYSILSTGRSGFIGLTCAILYDIYYCLRNKGIVINPGKMLGYIVTGFVGFILLFWQLGALTGKKAVLSFWDTLSIYIGSSILCFDKIIGRTTSFNMLGTNSFRGVYNLLARFGLKVTTVTNHMDKVRWNGYSSNVYTAFNPYYLDFGPVLSLVLALFAGLIIGFSWRAFKSNKNSALICVLFSKYIAGSFVMYSIAERLFTNTIAANAIVEIIFIVLIIKACTKRTVGQTDLAVIIEQQAGVREL